ncbi:iron-containing alcohol dehydrogenase [Agriterribacter sp.]|uniref:iron-containing alcohol dehydrogenase n=1 Tax=Agriterribacter sp. TaxID=2821509 RepID=UPI002BBDE825|nr:iron-containing alcohol dehydrogenase [Agriterribacter sp.]HRO45642.1 iron-containing alcohol dehydrogenase [Agriterribacter sp.]HRQ17463.1 iron-containing alcohol dehydrogenase [Agriterribacter sp.]
MIKDLLQIYQPRKLNFGSGCLQNLPNDLQSFQLKRVLIVTLPAVLPQLQELITGLEKGGIEVTVDVSIRKEPTCNDFEKLLDTARRIQPECVLGIGGGSVMDVAKLVAAQVKNTRSLADIMGINKLKEREILLICSPTTSGTGSEVSPNAILLDESDNQKKGIISPFLVPDMVYADPLLTVSLPAAMTAATGIDALTHCIEAYANRFAHPLIDVYALEGIRLISANLVKCYQNGNDPEARAAVSLGSLFGGICLGPVNTAAVHALAYPLGSHFHIAHGLSNALLLPHVLEFNLPAAPERYAAIATAMGCSSNSGPEFLAKEGIQQIIKMMKDCNMPLKLSELDIPVESIAGMAEDAMKVTRLLKNNVRELQYSDAVKIYQSAY